jgi:hypothetical protein
MSIFQQFNKTENFERWATFFYHSDKHDNIAALYP